MKIADVQVNKVYAVRVSGRLVPVRIIEQQRYPRGSARRRGLAGLNLATSREVRLSAARCQYELVADPQARSGWAPAPQYCDICGRDGKHSTQWHERAAGRSTPPVIAIPWAHIWAWQRDHEDEEGHGGARLDGVNCTVCPHCRSGLQMHVQSL